jgi:hypothetical protein
MGGSSGSYTPPPSSFSVTIDLSNIDSSNANLSSFLSSYVSLSEITSTSIKLESSNENDLNVSKSKIVDFDNKNYTKQLKIRKISYYKTYLNNNNITFNSISESNAFGHITFKGYKADVDPLIDNWSDSQVTSKFSSSIMPIEYLTEYLDKNNIYYNAIETTSSYIVFSGYQQDIDTISLSDAEADYLIEEEKVAQDEADAKAAEDAAALAAQKEASGETINTTPGGVTIKTIDIIGTNSDNIAIYDNSVVVSGELIRKDRIDQLLIDVKAEIDRRNTPTALEIFNNNILSQFDWEQINLTSIDSLITANDIRELAKGVKIPYSTYSTPFKVSAKHINDIILKVSDYGSVCTCDCDYCTCNCNYCTCNCNYCTCNCHYSCTCNCHYYAAPISKIKSIHYQDSSVVGNQNSSDDYQN